MAEAEQTTESEVAPTAVSSGRKLLPILLVIAGGLVAGGGSGFFMAGPALAKRVVGGTSADSATAAEEVTKTEAEGEGASGDPGTVFLLDNMVLNPANSSGDRFLLVSIALRLKDAAVEADLKSRDAEVRDALLRVLGSKPADELSDIARREQLKHELRVALDAIVKPGSIKGLYFPQFVIQ